MVKTSLKVSYHSDVCFESILSSGWYVYFIFMYFSSRCRKDFFCIATGLRLQSRNVNLNIMQKTVSYNFSECFIHIPLKDVSVMWPIIRQFWLVAHQFGRHPGKCWCQLSGQHLPCRPSSWEGPRSGARWLSFTSALLYRRDKSKLC